LTSFGLSVIVKPWHKADGFTMIADNFFRTFMLRIGCLCPEWASSYKIFSANRRLFLSGVYGARPSERVFGFLSIVKPWRKADGFTIGSRLLSDIFAYSYPCRDHPLDGISKGKATIMRALRQGDIFITSSLRQVAKPKPCAQGFGLAVATSS
jgi:hypothetical protein